MIDFILAHRFPGYVDACDSVEEALQDETGDEPYEEWVHAALLRAAQSKWTPDCSLTAEQHDVLCQALTFRNELNVKADAELRFLCAESATVEASTAEAALSDTDRWQFFNEPKARADFDRWGNLPLWTPEEAASLCLGQAPTVVNMASLAPLAGTSGFASRYADLLDLVQRAVDVGELPNPLEPSSFVTWSERAKIEVPPELQTAVRRRSRALEATDPLHAALVQERDALLREKESLQERVRELEQSVQEREIRVRERRTLLGIIIGMAVAKYHYKPEESKSSAPGRIAGHVDLLGIQVTAETVREKLKEAISLMKP